MLMLCCGLFANMLNAQTSVLPIDSVTALSERVRQAHVPDRRVGIYSLGFNYCGDSLYISGQTTSAAARAALRKELAQRGIPFSDAIHLLPDNEALENRVYGVVNLSVCNLHDKDDFASEMVTQALLGMPVKLLDHTTWYRIQTPDNYIAWVHRAAITPMTQKEQEEWNSSEKIVVTSHYGFVYEAPDAASQTVSDVVAGNRLKWQGTEGDFYHVAYPDGRTGYISTAIAQPEPVWRKGVRQDAESIIATAKTLMGVPYLWAGTSSKGIDCSGLVRTVLLMHDIIIPRDASQQAFIGQRMEVAADCANLEKGDLIFFGKKATDGGKERVVHVGIYIGNRQFIHSQGDVHISSFDSSSPLFDAFNLNRLLFATRFLDAIGTTDITTTLTNPYYFPIYTPKTDETK